MKRLIVGGLVVGFLITGFGIVQGCGGEEDDCLVDQENCLTDYVEANYGDGRGCCSGLTCSDSPAGNLICQ